MTTPYLPETAPFSVPQRAWLNGYFAAIFTGGNESPNGAVQLAIAPSPASFTAAPAAEEDFPWHDPALTLTERLQLAEGKPPARKLMAAMAQLDCGSCGYVCQTYAEAIARGEEKDLTKCSPGGTETARKLKELTAGRQPLPAVSLNGNGRAGTNGHAKSVAKKASTESIHDRKNPFAAPLLQC